MKAFSIGDLIKQAWKITEKNWVFVFRIVLIGFGLSIISSYLSHAGQYAFFPDKLVFVFTSMAISLLSVLVHIGFLKLGLRLIDGEKPKVEELLNYSDLFLKFVIVSVLYGVAIFCVLIFTVAIILGLIFFFHSGMSIGVIIAGIVFFAILAVMTIAIRYMFAVVLVVDQNLHPIEALKKSSQMTEGIRIDLFAFVVISILLNILGAIFIGIGLVVTAPVTFLAYLLLYRRVLKAS